MKIAIVGKGGSGKSSISWLLCEALLKSGKKVLAIDADHNQNLAESFGVTVDEKTPTIHHSHSLFMEVVNQKEDKKWANIVLDNRELPTFSIKNPDRYTASLLIPVKENLHMMIGGLGNVDIVESGRCAHGNISPLKYYLPLLNTEDHTVVIDGVAGVDMLNFGLFSGVDALVIVEEDHMHSKKVSAQIRAVAERFSIPFVILQNKGGGITLDEGIRNLFIEKVDSKNIEYVLNTIEQIKEKINSKKDHLNRLRNFEAVRAGHTT